jgi:hypothetical protein
MTAVGRRLVAAPLLLLLLLGAGRARAGDSAATLYAIVIGQNEVPNGVEQGLANLHYADDDAAAFYSFIRELAGHAFLLTIFDAETARTRPELVAQARPPTRQELDATVETIKRAMEADLAAGRRPSLLFFYSGHGIRTAAGSAALALLDEPLDQQGLYDRVLARLPATVAHVIIDACHAEALIRPRDADAQIEPLDPEQERSYLRQWTLARFPHVGALLASTSSEQSFEWDAYHGGVFAHELLSALRGGADVNGDHHIEYSEVAAFLAAANFRISDPRVRPHVVIQAPQIDRRAAIVDLSTLRNHFLLEGRATGSWAQPFFVESEAGARLVDLHPDADSAIAIHLPAGQPLMVIRSDGEARVTGIAGARVALNELKFTPPHALARGSAELAIRRGLFAAAFGGGFYEGYISQQSDLIPVALVATPRVIDLQPRDRTPDPTRRSIGTALLAGAAASAVGALIYAGLVLHARAQYQDTNIEHEAADARSRFERYRRVAGIAGALTAGLSLTGVGFLIWSTKDDKPADRGDAAATGDGERFDVKDGAQ